MGLAFGAESWIWYGFAVAAVVCRLISRSLHFKSISKLQIDDFLMLVVIASDTALLVVINIEAKYRSNLIAPGDIIETFPPQERAYRIYGSKLTVVVEQLQCFTVWTTKTCLMCLYWRITKNLKAHKVVAALAIYIGTTYIIMQILYFAVWCRPFYNYWALPTPSTQCSAATNHLITYAVFNISSDLIMLGIGFSLFINNKLPWNRKAILCLVFSLGIFVILCSVLNKYYSFSHPFGSEWTYWYVRESSTAILVANLPFLWPLLRKLFKLKSFDGASDAGVQTISYHSARSARGRHAPKRNSRQSHYANGRTHTRNSSGRHSVTSSVLHSPARIRSMVEPPPRAQTWKTAGVYGREEADALAIDPWDYGNDEMMPVEMSETGSLWSDSSPRSIKVRRLRDEEAQIRAQEERSPTYMDFGKLILENEKPVESVDVDLEKGTSEDTGSGM